MKDYKNIALTLMDKFQALRRLVEHQACIANATPTRVKRVQAYVRYL
jgi:hypothetical protein